MMGDFFFYNSVCIIGLLVVSRFTPRLDRVGVAVFAPCVGLVGYILCSFVLLKFSWFSLRAVLLLELLAALVISISGRSKRRRSGAGFGKEWLAGAIIVLLLVNTVVWLSSVFALTSLSKDSIRYLLLAAVFESSGSFDGVSGNDLLKRLIVVPLFHVPGVSGFGYSAAAGPVTGVLVVLTMIWLVMRGIRDMRPWRTAGAAVVVLSLFNMVTTNAFGYMLFYINGHMFFTLFLTVGAGLSLAARGDERRFLLALAALSFSVLPLLRVEGVLVALAFLLPILASKEFNVGERWLLALPVCVVAIVWYLPQILAAGLLSPDGLGSPAGGNLLAASAFLVVPALFNMFAYRVRLYLLHCALAVCIAALLLLAYGDGGRILETSFDALLKNMGDTGYWGLFWWFAPLLLLFSVGNGWRREYLGYYYGIALFFVLLLLFPYLRDNAYRTGFSDSGNRMLVHVMPLLLLFFLTVVSKVRAGLPQRAGRLRT